MAQVFRRKWTAKDGSEQTSKVYYCRFQAGGKDYLRSTGKTKRADALAEMRRIMDGSTTTANLETRFLELQRSLDELPEAEKDKARQDFARRLQHGIGEKLAIADTWETWKKHPNTGSPAPKTLNGYKAQWNRFEKWAKKQGIQYLHETTPAHAEKYAANLWEDGISPRTFNAHVKHLQSTFKALRLAGSVEVNPFDHIRRKEAATESRRSLTADELTTIFDKAEGDLRYLVALGIFTGMRLGDCVNLRWDEIDLEAGIITHIPAKTRRKGKTLRVPIHAMLKPILSDLQNKRRGKFLFPKLVETYLRDASAISKMFTTFLRDKCEIKTNETAKSVGTQRKNAVARVGFHSLRHSFVSLCAAEGVPQVALQELVGHGSPAMTAIYSHAGDEQKKAAVAVLPSFGIENGGPQG